MAYSAAVDHNVVEESAAVGDNDVAYSSAVDHNRVEESAAAGDNAAEDSAAAGDNMVEESVAGVDIVGKGGEMAVVVAVVDGNVDFGNSVHYAA